VWRPPESTSLRLLPQGVYKSSLPLVPGSEAAGTIEEWSRRHRIQGRRCCGFRERAGQLRRVCACCRGKPGEGARRLTMEQAAAAMLQGMTAHYLVYSTFPLRLERLRWFTRQPAVWGCCSHRWPRALARVSCDCIDRGEGRSGARGRRCRSDFYTKQESSGG